MAIGSIKFFVNHGFKSPQPGRGVPQIVGSLLSTLLATQAMLGVEPSSVSSSISAVEHGVELIGVVRIKGGASDSSGLTQILEDGSPANRFGGLSGIEYTGEGDRFILLADRGAGDGAVDFPCRFHKADLTVDIENRVISFRNLETVMICMPNGHGMVGSLRAYAEDQTHSIESADWSALDCEGVRRLADGSLVMCDEYGPRLITLDSHGRITQQWPVAESVRPTDQHGRSFNRGYEGLAITPDGNRILVASQSVLMQDGHIEDGKCLGLNSRWEIYDSVHSPVGEVVYQLDHEMSGVSELLAVDDDRFLVLERDGNAGVEAKVKRIYLSDISSASDVAAQEHLPVAELPSEIRPVEKKLLIDLLDPKFGISGDLAAEKPEGLCWGKPLSDGRQTLWVCVDNDFDPARSTEIYCFAISQDAIAGAIRQETKAE